MCACHAEVRTLTLHEAVDLALKQNPDVVLARLDERKAEQAVRIARDPFVPKVVAGSGLAYSSGFPMSIEGATPSIVQARAIADVFNRPQSYRVAAAREDRRGAAIDTLKRQDEIVCRTAELFLDAERARKVAEASRREIESLTSVLETVRARVAEGRELPIEARKAELNVARAKYRAGALEAGQETAETSLAALLGFEPGERVRPAAGERPPAAVPPTADAAVDAALSASKEVRSLESKLLAKGLEVRSQRAGRLPSLDLVAQYALLAKYNNYEKFFRTFQRNNGQLGISVQIPLWNSPGFAAAASQAEIEAAQLRTQIRSTRNRIAADTRRAYGDMQQAEAGLEVARLDLDVTREQVSVLLAQMQEGRVTLSQVEGTRVAETDKWIALYDASATLEKARLAVLRLAGGLEAALR